jgi:anti-sigma-K factor RskA
MDCSGISDQLEAYTLGALDAEERQTVERHLAGCADCRRLAEELAAAAHLVPLALAAASPQRPPADLKDRVFRSLQAPSMAPQPAASDAANVDVATPRPRILPVRPAWWRPRTLVAVAAILVLALSLAWSVRLSEALDRERALRERVAGHFSQQQEIVLEVVDSDEATRVILRPPDADSQAYGKLFTRPDLPHVVAMAARLPVPPEGQTYHLWLTSGDRTFLAGVLPVNDQGFGLLVFDANHDGPTYDAALLTLQPPGDSAPAGETVLAWSRSVS